MSDGIMDWVPIVVAMAGSISGGYLGVKLAVTKLQTEMEQVKEEIRSLRESRHRHAAMIQDHEARLHFLEKQK